ncbi:MAG: hypothetical protein RSE00_05900 [Clostridia bacterium]
MKNIKTKRCLDYCNDNPDICFGNLTKVYTYGSSSDIISFINFISKTLKINNVNLELENKVSVIFIKPIYIIDAKYQINNYNIDCFNLCLDSEKDIIKNIYKLLDSIEKKIDVCIVIIRIGDEKYTFARDQ